MSRKPPDYNAIEVNKMKIVTFPGEKIPDGLLDNYL